MSSGLFARWEKSRPGSTFCLHPTASSLVSVVQYILDLSKAHPDRNIVVVIPELVEDKWYEYFLHNQRGRLLEWVLLSRGNERIFTVSAPWYVGKQS